MPLFTRRPKKISPNSRYTKLYFGDDKYVMELVKGKTYDSPSDAIRDLVNEAIRVRQATERGKDETLYAVVKKQQEVVHEGTKPLVESIERVGARVTESLGRHDVTITDLAERLAAIERHTARQTAAVNRLLEITVICYGILRHYVLGLFVVRLTKQNFETYAEGFRKRLELFRTSVRAGNLLLEGDYEQIAGEFAEGLAGATTVPMPATDADQKVAQRHQPPVTGSSSFNVPPNFPTE